MKLSLKTLFLLLMFAVFSNAKAVEVTFRVDMSNETVSPLGVHIAGSFQGWDPAGSPMTYIGDNIYELTFDLTPGSTALYKFINGNSWANVEPIIGPCTSGPDNNRTLVVPEQNTILSAVCFGSCNICNPPTVEITFQVDMSQQNISPQGVFIAGSFNNWNTTASPMNHIGDDVYALTFTLGVGNFEEYKFLNGGTYESVPQECGIGAFNNRFINVPAVSTTLDAICFSSCDPCGDPPIDIEVTFQVDMSNETVSPDGVHIAGGFQGWNPGGTLMTHIGDNIYTYTTILPSGSYQEYKFVNGNDWPFSENVPEECGINNNRFFTVPQTDIVLDLVCYGECGPCSGPVQTMVTFQVDMSEQNVSPDGVHFVLRGGNPLLTPMMDQGDNIWAVTMPFFPGDSINYKFSNGLAPQNYEQVPEECRVGNPFTGYWRYYNVPGFDLTLDPLCYAACTPCNPVEVTFRVDMSNEEISPDGVHLAGNFQGWNASATPMTDAGDGIFEISLLFAANQYLEFKYINGNDFAFSEIVPEECGVDDGFGNFNRFFTVSGDDVILDLVCFGSCDECVIPVEVEVTFSVDMSNEVISLDGVHIAGSFQGWQSDATPMIPSGEGIFTYTATLIAGDEHEYKYINGNSFDFAEIVPEECSQNGNRFLLVPDEDITLETVCFGWCGDCPDLVEITFSVDMSEQEVSPNGVHLIGDFQGWDPEATPLSHIGEGIYTVEILLPANTYQTYRFINGNSYETGITENVPEECGVEDGFGGMKRFLDVPAEPTVLDVVCFGLCTPCAVNQQISLPAGWSGLSSFLIPDNEDIEVVFGDILTELVIVQNMTGYYHPAAGVNTLNNWDSQSGYQIKLTEAVTLTIAGQPAADKTIQLNEGWNLIPVISDQPVDIQELFAGLTDHVAVVKAVADVKLFWPEYGINTIGVMLPGNAYFVKMTAPAAITFP